MMATVIVLYSVCACAFIVWCSLQSNLAYRVITDRALNKWKTERENLIVINLFTESDGPRYRSVDDALEIQEQELAGLLQWIPRKSTLVFCHRMHIQHFDERVEEALLRAAIDTVYLLDVWNIQMEPATKSVNKLS
ncbi:MAG: hypothetical protein WB630_17580 [Candidatus Acidiferrales bacterium]